MFNLLKKIASAFFAPLQAPVVQKAGQTASAAAVAVKKAAVPTLNFAMSTAANPFINIMKSAAQKMVTGAIVYNENDIDVLARTMWGEARSEGSWGMQAVGNVVMNRLKKSMAGKGYNWGKSISEICLFPWQFSAWNKDDPNRARMLAVTEADPKFAEAKRIARLVVTGQLPDITGGADHYHTTAVRPSWKDASKKTTQIGTHVFYDIA